MSGFYLLGVPAVAPQPQVVLAYHGTKFRFSEFHVGEDGVCFTTDRRAAGRYAGRAGRVITARLTFSKPYVTDLEGWNGEAWAPATIKEGEEHDSYIVRDWAGPGRDMIIVFSSAQIEQVAKSRGRRGFISCHVLPSRPLRLHARQLG